MSTITQDFQLHSTDSGSTAVQIIALTQRILTMTEHMKAHRKDNHSKRGLLRMVNQRRRLLAYLQRTQRPTYQKLIAALGLRH